MKEDVKIYKLKKLSESTLVKAKYIIDVEQVFYVIQDSYRFFEYKKIPTECLDAIKGNQQLLFDVICDYDGFDDDKICFTEKKNRLLITYVSIENVTQMKVA